MEGRAAELQEMQHSAYQRRRGVVSRQDEPTLNRPPGIFIRGSDPPAEPEGPPTKKSKASDSPPPRVSAAPHSSRAFPSKPTQAPEFRAFPEEHPPKVESSVQAEALPKAIAGPKRTPMLTLQDVQAKYSEQQICRIIRWYEGVKTTIPDFERYG